MLGGVPLVDHGSEQDEIVPVLIVLGLFAATMVVENKEVANPKTNVTIDVNAFQWGWKFTYPGQNVVVVGQVCRHRDRGPARSEAR